MSIHTAIENLPEHLITLEIAQAAIEEGSITILNTLPHRFLNGEIVMSLINRNAKTYSYEKLNLKNIPVELRSKEVCEFAIKQKDSNILHTPTEHISVEMLSEMVSSAESNLRYLHLFPESLWSLEHIYKGINSIYYAGSSRYGRSEYDLKRVAIFMSYLPKKCINRKFYEGLFDTKLSAKDLDEMTPKRFKDKGYYLKIAKANFDMVPSSMYDYDILTAGIKSDKVRIYPHSSSNYYGRKTNEDITNELKQKAILDAMLPVMDAKMANLVIERSPTSFEYLPKKFQNPKRLILAIQTADRDKIVSLEGNEHLFTEEVCKAYVSRNRSLPTLPTSIWTPEFVEFCMSDGKELEWLDQLPQELQTIEIAETALEKSLYNARYIRPELITLDRAKELHTPDQWRSSHKEYVPKHYITDFCNETGLDEAYFSGELSYSEFRAQRKKNTFCRIGHSFIAFKDMERYNYKDYRIILTRRSPRSFKPEQVFEAQVDTFHSTWLEKVIADYDRTYDKPSIGKTLKPYSINPYFSLKKVATIDGAEIYANNILGGTAYYTAIIGDDRLQTSSLEDMKEELTPIEEEVDEVVEEDIAA